jgi:hypothetical protein
MLCMLVRSQHEMLPAKKNHCERGIVQMHSNIPCEVPTKSVQRRPAIEEICSWRKLVERRSGQREEGRVGGLGGWGLEGLFTPGFSSTTKGGSAKSWSR